MEKAMKVSILLVLLMIATPTLRAQDVSGLLMDRAYVHKQISCILNRGPCDLIGKQIRGLLPEVLNNNCGGCTPGQMRHARRLVGFMQANYPKEWSLMKKLYGSSPYGRYGA